MAQPHGRGHQSHTYDIFEVLYSDEDTLTLTVRAAHQVAPVIVSLPDSGHVLSRQLFRGCVDSLALAGKGGRWESAVTLERNSTYVIAFQGALVALGVTDLTDPDVDLKLLRDAVGEFSGSIKRTLNYLVARVLRAEGHPNTRLAANLLNTKVMADQHQPRDAYSVEQIDHIETVCRVHVAEAIAAQQDLLRAMGFGVNGHTWATIPADDVVASARARDAQRPSVDRLEGGRPPLARAPLVDHADWAVLNPLRGFEAWDHHRKAQQANILRAVYPPLDVLIAGLAVQAIADNTGVNMSVLLREHAGNLQPTGQHTAQLGYAKARNHTAGKRTVKLDGAFSPGGIVRTMAGLTRFSRLHRTERLEAAGLLDDHVDLARRIYVIDTPDVRATRTIDSAQLAQHARRGPLYDRLADGWPGDDEVTLRFSSLRRGALARGVTSDPMHDVVDHTPRTRIDYLANSLPDVQLHQLITHTQDELHDDARKIFDDPTTATKLIKAIDNNQLADLRATACTNNGRDPDAPPDSTSVDDWCSRGLAACFVCPNGYRTLDHVPGLVALAEYTELLASGDPTEWIDGEAGLLHHYATETLRQFPTDLVDTTRREMDRTVELLDIHELYTEFRR